MKKGGEKFRSRILLGFFHFVVPYGTLRRIACQFFCLFCIFLFCVIESEI
jgi:hypothetical protein